MNYPVWELFSWGGGALIAVVAVVHVYVAHFAVGGGLWLVLTEHWLGGKNDPAAMSYLRGHAKFFLLLTMVFGGLTGVAIWLIISVLHPAATSLLIHTFVFGWATEWVCFAGEIVALFVYYYTFTKMEPRRHLVVGWLYFVFAWLSLVLIDGIIAFMLTPGRWLETKDFWDGFLNPSFIPSAAFRTFLALVFAGVYGLLTATRLQEPELRTRMVRWSAGWLVAPFLLLLVSAWWYLTSLPPEPKAMILGRNPEMEPMTQGFVWISAALFLGGLIMAIRMPRRVGAGLAVGLLVLGLMYMGAFEWLREAGRRPYIVHGAMLSTGLTHEQAEAARQEGLLKTARWVGVREITPETRQQAGREMFRLLCSGCHSVGGPFNDILARARPFDRYGMDSFLDGMGKMGGYMPLFAGNRAERQALADYIFETLQGRKESATPFQPPQSETAIPPFDPGRDQYVLLCWNDLGMHCLTDADQTLLILPPANTLQAQLIKRGESPELVTSGVEITYRVEPGFERPSRHLPFWNHAKALLGKDLPPDVGLAGKGMSGTLDYDAHAGVFEAKAIPIAPYSDQGGFNPYPVFFIEAKDKASGQVLARTQTVAPVSSEMGCKSCHGGSWRVAGLAGLSPETGRDILSVHDRINRTGLKPQAAAGKPVLCAACHADPALNAPGDGKRLSLSAAMHGWHANYLTQRGAEACAACHPDSPTGPTRCYRGLHTEMGLSCTDCHGALEDHALSLLKQEREAGKASAAPLMRHLRPRAVSALDQINPRSPWLNQPDCLNCHQDFAEPASGASGFNRWTKDAAGLYRVRADQAGVKCAACHGSPHALYPAKNPYSPQRDVIQPMQYQGNHLPLAARKNCALCHTVAMDDEHHHPNSLREPRNW